MSRATELAEREAAEAEAENPDTEPVEPLDPLEPDEDEAAEDDDQPSEPSSLTNMENMEKALAQEQRRHDNALRKALGEHFEDFAECPLCQVAGYAMPYGPGEVSPEQREAILTVMGEGGGPKFASHPSEVRCPECDGWGEMLNGSRRAEQATSACQKCMGTGHLDRSQLVAAAPALAAPVYPWTEPEPAPAAQSFGDEWGRPVGHPDYGIHPAQIVATVRTA